MIWRKSFWREWCFFYFSGQADSIEEDREIEVTKTDFQKALNNLVPSVSLQELRRYKDIQKQFTLAATKKWSSVSLLSYTWYMRHCIPRENVSSHFSRKDVEESWKDEAQWSVFVELRGVWICDETLSLVYSLSPLSKLRAKRRKWHKVSMKLC